MTAIALILLQSLYFRLGLLSGGDPSDVTHFNRDHLTRNLCYYITMTSKTFSKYVCAFVPVPRLHQSRETKRNWHGC